MATATGTLESPRAVATINGTNAVPTEFTIERQASGVSDTAHFTVPIDGNPDWSAMFKKALLSKNGKPVSQATKTADALEGAVYVKLFSGFPSSPQPRSTSTAGLSQRFWGVLDDFEPSFDGRSVVFSCRSLGAILTAARITTAIQNQTTVQFIQAVAKLYGLTVNVQMRPGQTPLTLAQVYGADFVVGLKSLRIWDVIKKCALAEFMDCWVDSTGDTLNYAAPELVTRLPYTLTFNKDLIKLGGKHSPQLAKNIRTEVRSYSPKKRFTTFTRTVTAEDGTPTQTTGYRTVTAQNIFGTNISVSTSTGATMGSDGTPNPAGTTTNTSATTGGAQSSASGFAAESTKEIYVIVVPNLTQQQCAERALAEWHRLSMLEYTADITIPVTFQNFGYIDITTQFYIEKCDWPSWDGLYWPRRMTERFSVGQAAGETSGGYDVEIQSVNHTLPSGQV